MQSGLELWLSPTTGVLSHLHNNYTLSSIFFIFGPSGTWRPHDRIDCFEPGHAACMFRPTGGGSDQHCRDGKNFTTGDHDETKSDTDRTHLAAAIEDK